MRLGWLTVTKVYPWLGFEQSIFKDQYYGARFVRDYVSDASCADKIIQLYEQKEEGRPLFVFNVTMQNHGDTTRPTRTSHRVFRWTV